MIVLIAAACASLTQEKLPDVRVVSAEQDAKVCKVQGVVGREIRFELLLPDEWNHRFVMGGGGGFVGSVQNQAKAYVAQGYASVGTDTGHSGTPVDASWALGDLERQVNFGHLAVHRVAETAKALVRAHYGADAERSYFVGCSNGGRQALMEAERYPDDFDGVVAGAPALDFTGLAAQFVRDAKLLYPRGPGAAPVPPWAVKLYGEKVLAACRAKDSVIDDPRACKPAMTPACGADGCLTQKQVGLLDGLHAGMAGVFPAQPYGGEADPGEWPAWITGGDPDVLKETKGAPSLRFAFGTQFFKYLVFGDPAWDYTKYDFATFARDTKVAAATINATNPDLSAFASRGHKALLWHGWADAALSAYRTVQFYDDAHPKDAVRLFLLPGVQHCEGGAGPDKVDWLAVLRDWVEKGAAPQSVVATGEKKPSRKICAYPEVCR